MSAFDPLQTFNSSNMIARWPILSELLFVGSIGQVGVAILLIALLAALAFVSVRRTSMTDEKSVLSS